MKRASFLAILAATQVFGAIAIQLIIVRNVGIGAETDSYIAAQSVALVIAAILQAGLQSIWLPKLSACAAQPSTWKLTLESTIRQSIILSFAAFSILGLTTGVWMPPLFSAFAPQQIEMTKEFLLIFAISSILTIVSYQLTTALRTRDSFLASEAISAVATAALIPPIYYFAKPGELVYIAAALATRSLFIITIQLKLLAWPSVKWTNRISDRGSWAHMRPVLMGASLYKTLPLIDRAMAALAPPGALTIFNLAQTGVGALSSILEKSLCAPLTAQFGKYAAENRWSQLKRSYRYGIAKITAITALYVLVMVLCKDQIEILAATLLNVSPPMSETLWWLCILLAGYLHVAASGTLVTSVIHSLNDTKTPVKIAINGFILSLPLKIFGFVFFGIKGIVIGSSIHYIINMVAMTIQCERKINDANTRHRAP